MEKMIYHDRTPILLHPEQANTWHWHAAPEWETQCREASLFAHADGWAAIGKESQYSNLLRARLKRKQL